jgi:sigma-B regulation protein RsbQ
LRAAVVAGIDRRTACVVEVPSCSMPPDAHSKNGAAAMLSVIVLSSTRTVDERPSSPKPAGLRAVRLPEIARSQARTSRVAASDATTCGRSCNVKAASGCPPIACDHVGLNRGAMERRPVQRAAGECMSVVMRHHVTTRGTGPRTMVFAHGFGCDQNMWRMVAPAYADRFRTVCYDLVGSGKSDLSAYDRQRHGTLQGHADDLIEVIRATADAPVVFVGHSVSAMIGLYAGIKAPELFEAHVMLGPSPCYINDGDYIGGFSREDIDGLLRTLEGNFLGWSSTMAPAIMGAPERPELGEELTNSFCRTDPDIAAHFARVTFLSDARADLHKLAAPTLIVQCSDDLIAPLTVGDYLSRALPNATLRVIDNVGHCPHLSAPGASMDAMDAFLAELASNSAAA